MPKLYTVKALAELFDRDEETIRCWIRKGVFPSAFKIEDGWYVPASDIKKKMQPNQAYSDHADSQQSLSPRRSSGFVNRWK